MEYLEEGFRKLQVQPDIGACSVFVQASGPTCKSKLKKFLTKEVFEALRTRKTPTFGSTLRDVIQSGVENLDSGWPVSIAHLGTSPPKIPQSSHLNGV